MCSRKEKYHWVNTGCIWQVEEEKEKEVSEVRIRLRDHVTRKM